MRLALLIFALIASPALARDLPPDQPTYEKPTFERPTPPEPPEPPEPPQPPTPEEPERPDREIVRPQATNFVPPQTCPKVKCITDANGERRAMFTANVQPDMYYLGRNFCASVPKEVTEITACCLANEGKYQIQYSQQVSKKSHWKAKQFCTCVLGLD